MALYRVRLPAFVEFLFDNADSKEHAIAQAEAYTRENVWGHYHASTVFFAESSISSRCLFDMYSVWPGHLQAHADEDESEENLRNWQEIVKSWTEDEPHRASRRK